MSSTSSALAANTIHRRRVGILNKPGFDYHMQYHELAGADDSGDIYLCVSLLNHSEATKVVVAANGGYV